MILLSIHRVGTTYLKIFSLRHNNALSTQLLRFSCINYSIGERIWAKSRDIRFARFVSGRG